MRFVIQREPWVIGQHLIPPTTIIDYSASDDFSRLALGRCPPANSFALDQEAYNRLRTEYPTHQIHAGPGVVQRAPGPEQRKQAAMQGELERLTREVGETQARL